MSAELLTNVLTEIARTGMRAAPPALEIGDRVLIDGDPCVIVDFDSDEDRGATIDYRNERTGRKCWISASGARVRMVRR